MSFGLGLDTTAAYGLSPLHRPFNGPLPSKSALMASLQARIFLWKTFRTVKNTQPEKAILDLFAEDAIATTKLRKSISSYNISVCTILRYRGSIQPVVESLWFGVNFGCPLSVCLWVRKTFLFQSRREIKSDTVNNTEPLETYFTIHLLPQDNIVILHCREERCIGKYAPWIASRSVFSNSSRLKAVQCIVVLWSRFWILSFVEMPMFGWDFGLMLSRDSKDEMWSRFMFELLIWLQEVTLARWTQPSGPFSLWQCLHFHWELPRQRCRI